jgi:hypothetical protein
MKILGAMAYGIYAGLASGVFDVHSVSEAGIIRYKENDLFQLGFLERAIPSHWTNF